MAKSRADEFAHALWSSQAFRQRREAVVNLGPACPAFEQLDAPLNPEHLLDTLPAVRKTSSPDRE